MSAVALASPSLPRFARRQTVDRAEARETERQLLISYHRHGDLAAREELAERCLPLARDLALRYTYTDEPFDDLLQVASLGLIKAIDRFDPDRGTKFTSYAAPTILGELKRPRQRPPDGRALVAEAGTRASASSRCARRSHAASGRA